MQIVSLFLALFLLVFVGLYLYAPFLERRARRVTAEEHEISSLMAEREGTIASLQELDFDFKLGKVPEEDYPVQRTLLLQRGADVLRRLDELMPKRQQADADARIERAVAARRKKQADPNASDEDLEALIAARRRGRKTKAAGFCPKCGKPVMAADKFCPSCGKALAS